MSEAMTDQRLATWKKYLECWQLQSTHPGGDEEAADSAALWMMTEMPEILKEVERLREELNASYKSCFYYTERIAALEAAMQEVVKRIDSHREREPQCCCEWVHWKLSESLKGGGDE